MSIEYYSGKSIYMMTDDERREYDIWRRNNPNSAVYAGLIKNFKESSEFAHLVGKIGWILFGVSILLLFLFPESQFLTFSIADYSISVFAILNGGAWFLLIMRYFTRIASKLIRFIGGVVSFVFIMIIFLSGKGFWWILWDFGKLLLIMIPVAYAADFLEDLMVRSYSVQFGDLSQDTDYVIGDKLAIYKEMQSKFGRKKARKMDIGAIYRERNAKNPRPKSMEGAIMGGIKSKIRKLDKESEANKEKLDEDLRLFWEKVVWNQETETYEEFKERRDKLWKEFQNRKSNPIRNYSDDEFV